MLPPSADHARKLAMMRIAMWMLLGSALLMLLLPLPLPDHLRYTVAGADLIAAAVVWLAIRQRRAGG